MVTPILLVSFVVAMSPNRALVTVTVGTFTVTKGSGTSNVMMDTKELPPEK